MYIITILKNEFSKYLFITANMYANIIDQFKPRNVKLGVKVSVIGAGFSGLFCAWLLNNVGFTVDVHEASNRIGGRVHSLKKGPRIIEAGAEFISLNHHLWLTLANHFGLGLSNMISEYDYTRMNLLTSMIINDHHLCNDDVIAVQNQLADVQQWISADANTLKYPAQPWKEHKDIQVLDYISIADKFDEWKLSGHVRQLLSFILSNDNVADISEQSYLGLLCQVKAGDSDASNFWDDAEAFKCSNGNDSLAYEFAKDLYIDYNTEIRSISYHDGKIMYRTDKKTYDADYIVVTASPAVWHRINFASITNLKLYTAQTGPAVKIINKMSNRFWISQRLSPIGTNTSVGQTWEATENQIVTNKNDQNIYLNLFAGGPQVGDEYTLLTGINKIYNYEFSPNMYSSEMINWPHMKYIETGYSYAALKQVTTVGELLYYPVKEYDNRLIFAGEHTSADFYGFMEGALQSGLRAALQIIMQVRKRYTIEGLEDFDV